MSVSQRQTSAFAMRSALIIALIAAAAVSASTYFLSAFDIVIVSASAIAVFVFSFLILKYRTDRFIYKRVKSIYGESLPGPDSAADMVSLTREVKKFASDKKLEIEMLKIREEYRREFLGNVAHELKTPLFTVQGYLSTLLDGAVKDKSVRQKYLERAEKGVERLIHIVQDLDMITRLEMGNLNLAVMKFDIVELVQSVFELLEMEASKKDILLHFDRRYSRPIYVLGDKERIRQAVINLVMNSIKYGKEKGSTEAAIEEIADDKVIVRITDNGQGIDAQYLPRLFERFFRVDKSGSRADGGSGLGLAIVKHIIEGHNEKIFVKSTRGEGSEFSFTLKKAE